jgi:hypothetical protein
MLLLQPGAFLALWEEQNVWCEDAEIKEDVQVGNASLLKLDWSKAQAVACRKLRTSDVCHRRVWLVRRDHARRDGYDASDLAPRTSERASGELQWVEPLSKLVRRIFQADSSVACPTLTPASTSWGTAEQIVESSLDPGFTERKDGLSSEMIIPV